MSSPAIPSGGVTLAIVLVVALALVGLAVLALVMRRRRLATMARAIRQAVIAELERDPALAGLQLRLGTRAPWSGQIVVEVAGVVQSPWYRYAVLRATERALARTFRNARLDDRVVVSRSTQSGPVRRSA